MGKVIELRPGAGQHGETQAARPKLSDSDFIALADQFASLCDARARELEASHPGAINATPSAALVMGFNLVRKRRGEKRAAAMLRDLLAIIEDREPEPPGAA